MKLLKNGFAFAIALLTISLTIAAHAGAFRTETKKIAQTPRCNPALGDNSLAVFLRSDCEAVDPCIDNVPVAQLYGHVNTTYTAFDCPATADEFCCAKLNLNVPFECENGDDGFAVISILCGNRP